MTNKRIALNAPAQCSISTQSPGQWRRTRDPYRPGYGDLDFSIGIAQTLELRRVDSLFFTEPIVPELPARGRARTTYDTSTLRENFAGRGNNHLRQAHPAYRVS